VVLVARPVVPNGNRLPARAGAVLLTQRLRRRPGDAPGSRPGEGEVGWGTARAGRRHKGGVPVTTVATSGSTAIATSRRARRAVPLVYGWTPAGARSRAAQRQRSCSRWLYLSLFKTASTASRTPARP